MDLSNLRALIAQAREDDEKATPGPWLFAPCVSDPEHPLSSCSWFTPTQPSGACTHVGDFWGDADGADRSNMRLITRARPREPVLARALEAALEVVEAAERMSDGLFDHDCDDHGISLKLGDAQGDFSRALSRFRAAVEGEA